MEGQYLRTGNKEYEILAKFWTKIFALTFGIGVATGIVMEFEFGTNIQQNNWYIVSYTYDGSTERAYYNGELINSKAKTGAISTNASYDLHIGYRGGGGWVGQIALVHIHNTALTTPEIQQNYNALKGRFGL